MKIMENDIRNEYVKRITNKYVAFAIFVIVLLILPFSSRINNKIALEFNQIKWNSQNVSHYRYQIKVICMCWGGPVTIEVFDDQVVSIVNDSNNEVIHENNSTVEGLFAIIQEKLVEADTIQVKYDRKYGFPISILIDPSRDWIDDERIYVISNFEVLP